MSSHSESKPITKMAWSLARAREFYSIQEWSEGYFDINADGHIVAKPDTHTSIDLIEVSEMVKQQGLSLPVLIRFPQILHARVKQIDAAFNNAARAYGNTLEHIQCYPIKVNQQRTVVEEILASDNKHVGLEVGSKTELVVALGMLKHTHMKLVCNGYKDRAYIRIALYAQSMGLDVFIVIENPSELEIIRQEYENFGLTPKLGLRLKLNSVAQGIWQNSGGRDAKFGLDASDILYCLERIKQMNAQSWLKLIHFHMGSQINKLDEFANGLQEALVVYGQIATAGFDLNCLDVGGGLAIDYASQHDTSYFSRAYTIQQYADVIVSKITDYCAQNNLKLPIVFSENGRAVTAHHAMLMTNVVKARDHDSAASSPSNTLAANKELTALGHALEGLISDKQSDLDKQRKLFEVALQENFLQGKVSLEQRAWAEKILQRCDENKELLQHHSQHDAGLTIDKYYCNFSVFQSLPDVWGLEQIFPITPLSRLDERPSKLTQLHDLTCDSDGFVAHYAYDNVVCDYLALHDVPSHEEYLVGFFLLGAYQEVLGDMHNLFGDTHAVNVVQSSDGQLEFTEVEIGDCVNELLASIHLQADQIVENVKNMINSTNTMNVISEEMLEEINNALYGYTYLDSIDRPSYRIKR